MTVRIEIDENAVAMLDEIYKLNYGMGMDALDHAGGVMRDAKRGAFRRSTTQWSQYYKDSKRKIYKTKGTRRVGRRVDHRKKGGTSNPENMSNFITSKLSESGMSVIVAGKHSRFVAKTRRNGKVVGFQKAVGATTKTAHAILQKLNSGQTDGDYEQRVRSRANSIESFRNARYKKRNFIEKGRSMAIHRVKHIIGDKLESLLQKEYNRANVNMKKVRTA